MSKPQKIINDISIYQTLGLIGIAYAFSFIIRLIWVWQFKDANALYWNNELMINTNDGYFFASGVQKELLGLHNSNPRVFGWLDYGVIFFTTLIAKYTPISLETTILYMPSIISSFVVIPIILIARLYNKTEWGFFAALLGSITWSYYNRTMTGYYDTDMFSAMAPMFILYFLMRSTIEFNLKTALYASIAITIYSFLYDQGKSVVFAMAIMYAIYILFFHYKEKLAYLSLILVFISLIPLPIAEPLSYLVKIAILVVSYFVLRFVPLNRYFLIVSSVALFLTFLFYGNFIGVIVQKVIGYTSTGTKTEGLHFYSVAQTVREAGQISFETFANRISGSIFGLLLAIIGYILLVINHRAFLLALPLVGIGAFALFGGLRFTVYAVPVAGLSAVYLFWLIGEKIIQKRVISVLFLFIATVGLIYPNITHIISYKVPTVLNKSEVQDLDKLSKIAKDGDYTLSWWDYGYPIWFYSNTNTLIDGGKHHNDNYLISVMLQTVSQDLTANLSRLAVETYVSSNYKTVADTLFKNKKDNQLNPNIFLQDLYKKDYKLPPKTRDIYLYLPYRMMNIFPTVMRFGNLDLTTGKKLRNPIYYPTSMVENSARIITFSNGTRFNTAKGVVEFGKQELPIQYVVATNNLPNGDIKMSKQFYNADGRYILLFLKNYGRFIFMDVQTFNSTYIQMFFLGKYDKELFKLVVSSAYSRIYKFKK